MRGYLAVLVAFLFFGVYPAGIYAQENKEIVKNDSVSPVVMSDNQGNLKEIKKVNLEGGIFRYEKSYIPLKSVFSQLGYTVSWNAENNTILMNKENWKVVLDLNVTPVKVLVNSVQIGSEIDPFVRNGVTYIPAFFVTYLENSSSVNRRETIQIKTQNTQIDVSYQTESDKPITNGKTAYLTFDDGPSNITAEILDILRENNVKATFFVVGRNISGHEDVLKREVEEGHAIGNHTYSHDYSSIYQSEDAFFSDLKEGANEIARVTGLSPGIIRFPGGSNNTVSKKAQDSSIYPKGSWIMQDLVREVKDSGYNYFDWNVSTGDAESNSYSVESAIENVKEGIGNGSKQEVIILAHDAAPKTNTVRALPSIIQYLKDEGYSFGTLDKTTPAIEFLK